MRGDARWRRERRVEHWLSPTIVTHIESSSTEMTLERSIGGIVRREETDRILSEEERRSGAEQIERAVDTRAQSEASRRSDDTDTHTILEDHCASHCAKDNGAVDTAEQRHVTHRQQEVHGALCTAHHAYLVHCHAALLIGHSAATMSAID